MSQYKTGTATVTNGSPTVTGTNTLWLANVTAGNSFTVAGDGVMYDVASVDSDTQITLSAPYAGTTASGAVYAIGTGFTVPDSFPEMSQGDIETATIFTRAMRKIQGKFSSILAGGANANFTAMPQVGGDPIVESGSNADGEWTRWSDGTQISVQTASFGSVSDGSIASASATFPRAYNTTPDVVTSLRSNNQNTARVVGGLEGVSTTGFSSYAGNYRSILGTTAFSIGISLHSIAKGRWK
jgi:hypothetical protein